MIYFHNFTKVSWKVLSNVHHFVEIVPKCVFKSSFQTQYAVHVHHFLASHCRVNVSSHSRLNRILPNGELFDNATSLDEFLKKASSNHQGAFSE